MNRCPVCSSSQVTQNERGDKRCGKCGWIHHEGKQRVIFTVYDEASNITEKQLSEIDKAMKRLGLE